MSDTWARVLNHHVATLPLQQQVVFRSVASPSDCLNIIVHAQSGRQRYHRVLRALETLIEPLKKFEGAIDVIVQVNAGIASPIWGPLRIAIGVASERLSTLQNLTVLLDRIVEPLARFKNYEELFRQNDAFQRALGSLYADWVGFCACVVRYYSRSSIRNVLGSFDKEFRLASESIRHHWTEVDVAANAANIGEARSARDAEAERREVQIKGDVLRWLTPSNTHDDYERQLASCVFSSSAWFFSSKTYAQLLKSARAGTVTIYGRPGEGKTFLATTVIEDLRARGSTVMFFFCKAGDPELRSAVHIIRTLLSQLLRLDKHLFTLVETIYNQSGRVTADSLTDVSSAFRSAIQQASLWPLYIVIDGLDECRDREVLITFIHGCLDTVPNCSLQFILFTREDRRIIQSLRSTGPIVILQPTAMHDAIQEYIQSRVDKMPMLNHDEVKNSVTEAVLGASDDLWLYARLMLDEIQNLPTLAMAANTLKNIPQGLHELYTQILTNQAQNMREWELQVIQQIFLWIDLQEFLPWRRGNFSDQLTLSVVKIVLQFACLGQPVHDPIGLVQRLTAPILEVYECYDDVRVVGFTHHTARQYVQHSNTVGFSKLPSILRPRRVRQLHRGVVSAWYMGQHPAFEIELQSIRSADSHGMAKHYFEFAYGLWDALKLEYLPSDLSHEECHEVTRLCHAIGGFISSSKCLKWIEMAIIINFRGDFVNVLLNNVTVALEAARAKHDTPSFAEPTFREYREVRQTFLLDYDYILRRTRPAQPRNVVEVPKMPLGFEDRPLAQQILKLGETWRTIVDREWSQP